MSDQQNDLTEDEKIFFSRALTDFIERLENGEDEDSALLNACKGVIKKDEELWLTTVVDSEKRDLILDEMSTLVYSNIRSKEENKND